MAQQRDDDIVLHQTDVEEVINNRLETLLTDGIGGSNTAIADLVAITGGESPTEAEHNLVVSKVNSILAALRNSTVIPDE